MGSQWSDVAYFQSEMQKLFSVFIDLVDENCMM